MSRMERDLSTSPHNLITHVNGDDTAMLQRVLTKGRNPHVCVIGAGISGLRCAAVLAEKGMRVTMLEGRNRIGGRVSIA